MEWSETKQRLFRFESDIAVSAGAGSGKTAALVELYLRLLAGETSLPSPLRVEEIVAITFTDKAAAEMRERVRRGVDARLTESGDRLWRQHRRDLSGAAVSTFHAFCARLLREHPAEAGIDPAFTLLDELAAEAELTAAVDELLAEEVSAAGAEFRALLRHFPLSGTGRGKGLREIVLDLWRRRAGTTVAGERLAERASRWDQEAARLFVEGVRRLAGMRGEIARILSGKELVFHGRLRTFAALLEVGPPEMEDTGTSDRLRALSDCLTGNWGKERPFREELETIVGGMELAWWQLRNAPLVTALTGLTERLAAAYERRKARRGALDFDDLQRHCHRLLARNEGVRRDCRERYRVLMVDEFQDTNRIQKELVDYLCEEKRLFVVGDPKQSIYLFRGADVEVFLATSREIEERGGQRLYFQESFRSRPGLITFVNRFFARVMRGGDHPFELTYGPGDELAPKRTADGDTACVELLLSPPAENAPLRRRLEAEGIARRIRQVVAGLTPVTVRDEGGARPPLYGEIAILFRRFSNLKLFERELRRVGIPYYVVKGRGFYQCQEILDLLNFLKYLEFGDDLVPLTGLLRSPLCGVSDETLYWLAKAGGGLGDWRRWVTRNSRGETLDPLWERIAPEERDRLIASARLVERLRPLRSRLTLTEILEEILAGTDFTATLLLTFQGEQKAANLRKLVELSRSFAQPGEGSLRRFINHLDDLVAREPTEAEAVISAEGEDVVRLMTVHQSKGLEFPVVFVPELGAATPVDGAPVQFDEELGVGMRTSLPGGEPAPSLAHDAIARLRRAREAAEQKRLLYVAVTRARDHLVLSGEGKGGWRAWLDGFLTDEGEEFVTRTELCGEELGLPAPAPAPTEELPPPAAIAAALDRAIHYRPPLPAELAFSPTALEDFASCPRKYFYKGVLGLDEGVFADLFGKGPGRSRRKAAGISPLEQGNLAHHLLERLDFSATPAERRRRCEELASVLADPRVPAVRTVLERVLAAAEALAPELAGARLYREHPFTLLLEGEGRYHLHGAMDLVALHPDRVTVYDYKYAVRKEESLPGYLFQVSAYMLTLSRAFAGRRVGGKLVFLRGDRVEVEPVVCDEAPFARQLVGLMDAIRSKEREEEFPLLPGCDGSHCPFRQRCAAAAEGGG